MKLKYANYLSAVFFFFSSATLLFIPWLDLDNGFTTSAYYLAGLFWIFLLLGIALQLWLYGKTRKLKTKRVLKSQKKIIVSMLLISIIILFFVLAFLRNNLIILPINLFVILIGIESRSIIHRMEKLL